MTSTSVFCDSLLSLFSYDDINIKYFDGIFILTSAIFKSGKSLNGTYLCLETQCSAPLTLLFWKQVNGRWRVQQVTRSPAADSVFHALFSCCFHRVAQWLSGVLHLEALLPLTEPKYCCYLVWTMNTGEGVINPQFQSGFQAALTDLKYLGVKAPNHTWYIVVSLLLLCMEEVHCRKRLYYSSAACKGIMYRQMIGFEIWLEYGSTLLLPGL